MANIENISHQVNIKSFDHKLEPLWGSGTGRNSNSGTWNGVFIGYFSQLTIEFGTQTQEQMNIIKSNFEKATLSITYPSKDGIIKTEDFYGTAINGKKNKWNGKYQPFSLTLTALRKYR